MTATAPASSEVLGRGGADDGLFRLRFAVRSARAARAPRPRAAAALHHAADDADDERRYQTVFAPARRGRGADGGAALRRSAARGAAARGIGAPGDAARRRRHVPAGAQRAPWPSTACTASGTRCRRPPSTPSRARGPRGGRIVAVGTTTLRTLESAALGGAAAAPAHATPTSSSRPASHFRVVDLLVTNFHLPRARC